MKKTIATVAVTGEMHEIRSEQYTTRVSFVSRNPSNPHPVNYTDVYALLQSASYINVETVYRRKTRITL